MRLFARRARMSVVAIRDRVQQNLDTPGINGHVRYLCEFLMRGFAEGRHGRYLEAPRADPVHRNTWNPQEQTAPPVVDGTGNSPARPRVLPT